MLERNDSLHGSKLQMQENVQYPFKYMFMILMEGKQQIGSSFSWTWIRQIVGFN